MPRSSPARPAIADERVTSATAHEAMRDSRGSARLVSTIGTRAPRTMPALDGAAQVHELLRQHVAALEIRHHQDVGGARDLGHDALGACRSRRDRVVERQRSVEDGAFDLTPVGHLAQRGCVQRGRHVRVDGFHRGEDRDARPREAEGVREVDRIAHDVRLVDKRRRDVERGVGDDERSRIRRRLHEEAVAHATAGAQRARHHGGHQLVGVQAALHQRVDLAAAARARRRAPRRPGCAARPR